MKKKLMFLLVATLFLTMMFSTGCKIKFDITGTWTFVFTWTGSNAMSNTITFVGDKASGTFSIGGGTTSDGTYTVDGKNVNWIYTNGTTYTGTASDDNNMNGTMVSNKGVTGTWNTFR